EPLSAEQLGFDLRQPEGLLEALQARGLDPQAPTAWVCEGLLEYHPPAFGKRLLQTITGAHEVKAEEKNAVNTGNLLVIAVLDRSWLDFLREQHSQQPVRMAWREDQLPPVETIVKLLRELGWNRVDVASEFRLPPADAQPSPAE
ncbi:unnamed protein product, partial [Polarella glacialis]